MSNSLQPTEPRASATVVLLRDGAHGPEVLLVLRNDKSSFATSYVFPGGVNEPGDAAVYDRCHGMTDKRASDILGVESGGLDYYVAAIRELFEESGILLAHRAGNDDEFVQVTDHDCDAHRVLLNSGELSWRNFLQDHGLLIACDTLHYFAFWVTPRALQKRFSTRFFMAALPDGQLACHDGGELTDSCWMRPGDALASADSKQMTLPPPTRATLRQLSRFASVDAALGWALEREQQGVACTLPALVGPRDAQRIVLPGSPDYPADHHGLQA